MGQRRTLNLLTALALFAGVGMQKSTSNQPTGFKHTGTTYGGGGRGTRDTGAIYTPQRRNLKGYQKDDRGRKVR